jgi:hypothetical protein
VVVVPFHQTAHFVRGRQARQTRFGNTKCPKQAIHFFFPLPFRINFLNCSKGAPLNRIRIKRLDLCPLQATCRRTLAPCARRVQKFVSLHFLAGGNAVGSTREEGFHGLEHHLSRHRRCDALCIRDSGFSFLQYCLSIDQASRPRPRKSGSIPRAKT